MIAAQGDLLPPDEAERLAAIERYDILDTPPDGAFDRVTSLAARVCSVPISTITIVDEDRIWFKSAYGAEVDQIGRDPGLCASAILGHLPYVVSDAAIDPRTLDNPLVRGEFGLRFYVGVPLVTIDGHNLGTLNIIDRVPREVEPDQLGVLQDLAAIVMDELELRLAARRAVEVEAAREAMRFRDAIVAGISHEMRTPLGVLGGALAADEASGPDDELDRARLHDMMRRQVRHLDWLLKQFLDYTSLEGDRPPAVELAATDICAIVAEAADVFADRAPIALELPPEAVTVLADRDRTSQICLELLNNAARFSPQGSPIDVVVRSQGDEVRLAVTDHGPGIEPEHRARLFERAYHASDSTGSGVGLFVSQTFAQAQGGRIEVASTPGDGSTFSLVLPVVR